MTHANNNRPSAAATPSKAFNKPLRLSVFTSEIGSFRRFEEVFLELEFPELSSSLLLLPFDSGVPVSPLPREVLRVKAASRSSRRRMQRAGTRPINVVSVLSLIHDAESETT